MFEALHREAGTVVDERQCTEERRLFKPVRPDNGEHFVIEVDFARYQPPKPADLCLH